MSVAALLPAPPADRRPVGRPAGTPDPAVALRRCWLRRLVAAGYTPAQCRRLMGLSARTYYRYLRPVDGRTPG